MGQPAIWLITWNPLNLALWKRRNLKNKRTLYNTCSIYTFKFDHHLNKFARCVPDQRLKKIHPTEEAQKKRLQVKYLW